MGEKKTERIRITLLDCDADHCDFMEREQPEDCSPYKEKSTVSWINIDGLHEVSIIEHIGNHFGIHPLIIEDILNNQQRPKMDMPD